MYRDAAARREATSFFHYAPAPEPGPASELDCVRHVLHPAVIEAAERRSAEVGVGVDRVLIAQGVIDEDAYLRRLKLHHGFATEAFDDATRADCPLSDRQLFDAASRGILPLWRNGELWWIIAPRGYAVRRLIGKLSRRSRVALASARDFNRFLMREAGPVFAAAAADGLRRLEPKLSAAPMPRPQSRWRRAARAAWRWTRNLGFGLAFTLPTAFPTEAAGAGLAVWFLAFSALRLSATFAAAEPPRRLRRLADRELPVYSVIVALYREAASVDPLLRALARLDYPAEKLDIKIVVEPDDRGTRAAIAKVRAALPPMPHLEVIVAPRRGPKTKPKALNAALYFARGTFVTVYDAEDRPAPSQLRAALDAFCREGRDVACVQAALTIRNSSERWLSCMFGVEYSGLFRALLPGLAKFGLPLPLGGTSNHFRREVLCEVGGWDAYNVTEDADLGMRLARFGYRSVTIDSVTDEEAPAQFVAWLKQRTRWMKGWMSTWSVHMRAPVGLWREAGLAGWLTLNLLIGGSLLTALAHPFIVASLIAALLLGDPYGGVPFGASQGWLMALHAAAIVSGYVASVAMGLAGLARHRRLADGWVLVLTPVYWLCLSLAAWRALFQLMYNPYHWEKTEHGLVSDAGPRGVARLQSEAVARRQLPVASLPPIFLQSWQREGMRGGRLGQR